MRLSLRTDYAFRVLIHLASNPDMRVTVRDISGLHGISHNHLVKVVNHLCHSGMVVGTRGRTGGIRLAMRPENINIGHVIRIMETAGEFTVCCQPSGEIRCLLVNACRFRRLIGQATDAFMAVLDAMNIQDIRAGIE